MPTFGESRIPLIASAPTVVVVGVASGSAVAANANRAGLVLVNMSANTISLGFDNAAVLASGITLRPGAIFSMDDYLFFVGQIFAIASGAGSNLAVQEFTT